MTTKSTMTFRSADADTSSRREGFSMLLANLGKVLRNIATFPQRRAVRDELSQLSDRELADIGLTRADVAHVFDAEFAARRDAHQGNLRAARRATA